MKFEELLGKTLVRIQVGKEKDNILFITDDGEMYTLYHEQSCCESVSIEDICGDIENLIGSPLLIAEEVTSEENPSDVDIDSLGYQESFTWTFYKLATVNGHVTIRWYGSSNGYYSESVEFNKAEKE